MLGIVLIRNIAHNIIPKKLQVIPFLLLLIISAVSHAQDIDTISADIDTSEYVQGDLDFNLIIAAENGYASEVLRLLKNGADVNSQTWERVTALMYAVQNEQYNTCKILLLNGADPNLRPYNGAPAIIAAVKTGNVDLTELLIRNGASVNATDEHGITPLLYAAAFNLPVMADMLLYYDANVNLADYSGTTALMAAAYYGNSEIVNLLISNHATLEKTDAKGFTALHCAAQNGNNEIAELLLKQGCDIEFKNKAGYSPLSIAVLNKNSNILEYLIEKGANVNSKISPSFKPLNIAKIHNYDTIASILRKNGARLNRLPAFSYTSLNFDFSGSANDFMIGGGLGMDDTRYGISSNIGYVTRIIAKQVLEKQDATTYYQYWEKRSYFYLGLSERINLLTWNNKNALGIAFGGQMLYTYGKYRGADIKPEKAFMLTPQGYVFVKLNGIGFSLRYEYINFNLVEVSPHRFNMGIHFLFSGKHIKQSTKKVLWVL